MKRRWWLAIGCIGGVAAGAALGTVGAHLSRRGAGGDRDDPAARLEKIYESARRYFMEESNSRGSTAPIARQFPGGGSIHAMSPPPMPDGSVTGSAERGRGRVNARRVLPPPSSWSGLTFSPDDAQPHAFTAEPRGSTEAYRHHVPNQWTETAKDALSTFAIDVDTASYAIVRCKILAGEPVPADAVRVEELLNYFHYAYQGPTDGRPFAVHMASEPTLATVHVRHKQPRGREAAENEYPFERAHLRAAFGAASADFCFAVAVMGAAEILRRSPEARGWRMATVRAIARAATVPGHQEREELLSLLAAISPPRHATRPVVE